MNFRKATYFVIELNKLLIERKEDKLKKNINGFDVRIGIYKRIKRSMAMIRIHSNKILIIFFGIIITLLCITILSSVHTTSNASAEEKISTDGTDKIKDLLLRTDGWIVTWNGWNGSGKGYFVFEARGDDIVVKINNITAGDTCEQNVTITSDVVKLDGCYSSSSNIVLLFDPNDHEYPFKGGNKGMKYKFKAK